MAKRRSAAFGVGLAVTTGLACGLGGTVSETVPVEETVSGEAVELSDGPRFAPNPKTPFTVLKEAEFLALAKEHSSRQLAGKVVQGPFGPQDDCRFAMGFPHSWLLCGDEAIQGPGGDWSVWEIDEMIFVSVDDDPHWEVVVHGSFMTGIGPEGSHPFPATFVYDWDGVALSRLPDIEAMVQIVKDPAKLRPMFKDLGKPVAN